MFTFSCSARHIIAGLAIILLTASSGGGGDLDMGNYLRSTEQISVDSRSFDGDMLSVAYTLPATGRDRNIAFDPGYSPKGKDKIIAIWGTSESANHGTNYEIVYNPTNK